MHYVFSKFISRIDFLAECHEGLVSDVAVAMHPFFSVKEENIYMQHEIAFHVFFVMKGNVCLSKYYSDQAQESELLKMTPGAHFGEVSIPLLQVEYNSTITLTFYFLQLELYHHIHGKGVRICSAIAKTYCELTFLSRQAISTIGGKVELFLSTIPIFTINT